MTFWYFFRLPNARNCCLNLHLLSMHLQTSRPSCSVSRSAWLPSATCNVQKSRLWLTWSSTRSSWKILLVQKPMKIRPEPYCKTNRALTLLPSCMPSVPLWKLTMRKIGTSLTLRISKPMRNLCLLSVRTA